MTPTAVVKALLSLRAKRSNSGCSMLLDCLAGTSRFGKLRAAVLSGARWMLEIGPVFALWTCGSKQPEKFETV